jgi:glycosyltransferase involved in cell wall biosynthesis
MTALKAGSGAPCKVLHLLGTAQPEGASIAKIVCRLARGLESSRYQIHAWFLEEDGPWVDTLREAGAQVRVLGWRAGQRDPMGALRFWKGLREGRFDILHQHAGGRTPRWLARRTGDTYTVLHLHHWSHLIEPVCIRTPNADCVLATSNAVARWVVDRKAEVVYPAVDIPPPRPPTPPGSHRIIGTAGRLAPMKGIRYLIQALPLIRARIADVLLEIAGVGPERRSLEDEASRLGMTAAIRWLGWEKDTFPLLARWQVYVQPSLSEPFGIAALEAMASGVPVVGTTGAGLEEIVVNGRTGWLVPAADPAALADRIIALLMDDAQRDTMGREGRARAAQHFSSERMVRQISDVYERLCGIPAIQPGRDVQPLG